MSLVYFIEFNQNIKNDLFMVWLFVENFPQTFNKTSCIHDDRARLLKIYGAILLLIIR